MPKTFPFRLSEYTIHKYIYLRGNILQSYKYFHDYKPEIRALMEFSQPLKQYVRLYTNSLYGNDTSHKVCIHTRLGDFKKHFLLESRLDFTKPAIRFVGKILKVNQIGNNQTFGLGTLQQHLFISSFNWPRSGFSKKNQYSTRCEFW